MIFKTNRTIVGFALTLILVFASTALGGDDVEDILSNVQKKYETIHDASVSFTQNIRFGVMKTEQSFSGKFYMRKGGMYRIEGEEQIIVTDGKSVWTYSKDNRQVVIDVYHEDPKSFSPDKVLINVPKNYSATILSDEKAETDVTVLKLIPKDDKSQVKWMKVWISREDWLMRKCQIEDVSDNLTTYAISKISLNTHLPDSLFLFSAPKGVEVIDLR